jgi:prepilin peptidase CpaA
VPFSPSLLRNQSSDITLRSCIGAVAGGLPWQSACLGMSAGGDAMANLIFSGAFLVWTTWVATSDIRFRRISNLTVLAGLIGGGGSTLIGSNPFGIAPVQALVGILAGLVGLLPFFLLRVMGAADVKIFAVLGAWCGVHALLWLWVAASLVAGIHALVLLLLSRTSFSALRRRGEPALALGGFRATPYAACLAIPAAAWLIYLFVQGGVR